MGQISFNLLKKAYATWQYAFLSTSNGVSRHFCSGMRRNRNFEKVTDVFRLLVFFHFIFKAGRKRMRERKGKKALSA